MAKIDTYREKVRQIIAGYAQRLSSSGNDELETVFDTGVAPCCSVALPLFTCDW